MYKKQFQKHTNRIAGRVSNLDETGYASVVCQESTILNARVVESTRRAVSRLLKRVGLRRAVNKKLYPFTRKPNEMRMGKGRGDVSHTVVKATAGSRVFELCVRNQCLEKSILKKLAGKFGFKKLHVLR